MRMLKLAAAALVLPALLASCDGSGSPVDGAASGGAGAPHLAATPRRAPGAAAARKGRPGAAPADRCRAAYPDRLFCNDFEDGRFYAGTGMAYDPSRDFVVSDPTRFGVVAGTVMAAHGGQRSLRGNFWEWIG